MSREVEMTAGNIELAGEAFRKGFREGGGEVFQVQTQTDAAFVSLTFGSMGRIGAQLLANSTPNKRAEAVRRFRAPQGKERGNG